MLIQFTIHTYHNTSRTMVLECADQVAIEKQVDYLMSDTTGQTKAVTHEVYTKPELFQQVKSCHASGYTRLETWLAINRSERLMSLEQINDIFVGLENE